MKKIINYENLSYYTYSNDKLIKGRINGIVLNFCGLNTTAMCKTDPGEGFEFAEKGIVYLTPYYDPWCWMNRQTVRFVDEIIEVICERYGLDESVRIVSTGRSMGGLCSLVYCAYARITPVLCVANCPVCDLVYHFDERADLPRTLYSAFGEYDGTMADALSSCSPLHIASKMPDIPYRLFHCESDELVEINAHSVTFTQKMTSLGKDVTLTRIPYRRHCDLGAEATLAFKQAVMTAFV